MTFCVWTQNEDGYWETACDNAFEFTVDGPVENGMIFCPYCGQRLQAVPLPVPVVDDDE